MLTDSPIARPRGLTIPIPAMIEHPMIIPKSAAIIPKMIAIVLAPCRLDDVKIST